MRKRREVPAAGRHMAKQQKLKGKFSVIHPGPKAGLLVNQCVD